LLGAFVSKEDSVFDTLYEFLQKTKEERLRMEQESSNDDKIDIMDNFSELPAVNVQEVKRKRKKSVSKAVKSNVRNQKSLTYQKQEAKRAPKVQIDQKIVLWSWIIGIAVAFISSAVVSFNGITSVATFVGLSQDWMAGLFFFFIELMYLLFLVAYLVLGSRVDEQGKPERTAGALWGMISFGGIAVLANAFHTLDFWQFNWFSPQMWAGVVLSVSAPIAIISASKMSSRIVFAKAIKL
jgi:hypothetical protein